MGVGTRKNEEPKHVRSVRSMRGGQRGDRRERREGSRFKREKREKREKEKKESELETKKKIRYKRDTAPRRSVGALQAARHAVALF